LQRNRQLVVVEKGMAEKRQIAKQSCADSGVGTLQQALDWTYYRTFALPQPIIDPRQDDEANVVKERWIVPKAHNPVFPAYLQRFFFCGGCGASALRWLEIVVPCCRRVCGASFPRGPNVFEVYVQLSRMESSAESGGLMNTTRLLRKT